MHDIKEITFEQIQTKLFNEGISLSTNTVRNHVLSGLEKIAKHVSYLYGSNTDLRKTADDKRFQEFVKEILLENDIKKNKLK